MLSLPSVNFKLLEERRVASLPTLKSNNCVYLSADSLSEDILLRRTISLLLRSSFEFFIFSAFDVV
ncbi:hypothetical protein Hanom_Chr07g00621581 [Helianthus anomalus]